MIVLDWNQFIVSFVAIWCSCLWGTIEATSCGSRNFTADSGAFTSPNFPKNYDNDHNCEWNIGFNTPKTIYLFIDYFYLEDCCDHLKIYKHRSLVKHVGKPQRITIHSNTVQITFTSDGSLTKSGWSMRWRDFDECTNRINCSNGSICSNTIGSYTCRCGSGFTGDGLVCEDKDECALGTYSCDVNAYCINRLGSYSCRCNEGFTGNGRSCMDVDECALGTHSCDTNATCYNTVGSFICKCNPGHSGDGFECSVGMPCGEKGLVCFSHSTCGFDSRNHNYYCSCINGFTGNGQKCTDVDECANDTYKCHSNAHCNNTIGSYNCTCNDGYQGDGWTCWDIQCDLPQITNGSRLSYTLQTAGNITVGTNITYSCSKGHELSRTSQISTCSSSGEWSSTVPTCVRVGLGVKDTKKSIYIGIACAVVAIVIIAALVALSLVKKYQKRKQLRAPETGSSLTNDQNIEMNEENGIGHTIADESIANVLPQADNNYDTAERDQRDSGYEIIQEHVDDETATDYETIREITGGLFSQNTANLERTQSISHQCNTAAVTIPAEAKTEPAYFNDQRTTEQMQTSACEDSVFYSYVASTPAICNPQVLNEASGSDLSDEDDPVGYQGPVYRSASSDYIDII